MEKILVDLDVVVVALWASEKDSRKMLAKRFITQIEQKRFFIVTPAIILELVSEWKGEKLKADIINFYTQNTNIFVEDSKVIETINSSGIDFEQLANEVMRIGIKDEDAFLVLTASAENIDYLVTFNRKHLTKNESKINALLKRYKLDDIKIVTPEFFG